MQNSYTKEGQLSWWLALLEYSYIYKGRGSNPPPFRTQKYFNFYPKPTQARRPACPAWGPTSWATGLRFTKGPAQPAPGWAMGLTSPARPVGDPYIFHAELIWNKYITLHKEEEWTTINKRVLNQLTQIKLNPEALILKIRIFVTRDSF